MGAETQETETRTQQAAETLIGLLALAGLCVAIWYNYLLFHGLAEIFSIVVACCTFVVAWNSRRFLDNHYLLFIGIAYFFIAALDLVHTLTYKGMGVLPLSQVNPPTQLWIASRYLQSLSLLTAALFLRRRLRTEVMFAVYAAIVCLVLLCVFRWRVFPVCIIDRATAGASGAVSLTPFKKTSEFVISAIFAASAVVLFRNRGQFDKTVLWLMEASIATAIASELSFSVYTNLYGFLNDLGHVLKIASFYLVYKAIVETGLRRPYQLLFRELKIREEALQADVAQRKETERKLEAANKELEAANIELESFSYSVSHDLRAPLRTIDSYAEMLARTYGGQIDEEGRRCLDAIQRNAKKMDGLIRDLLDFSRLARQELRFADFNMRQLAESVVEELRPLTAGRALGIYVGELPPARGDEAAIRQALVNLLSNAIKFTAPREAAVIEVGGERGGEEGAERNVYYVKDNGVGFDMKHAQRLFGVFQRFHRAGDFEGTGVGLAIVKRVIERHGGRVWAEAAVNEGATFCFTLAPASRQEEARPEVPGKED